jgi:hypothetical protein
MQRNTDGTTSSKILDLDPLSVQSNKTLSITDHAAKMAESLSGNIFEMTNTICLSSLDAHNSRIFGAYCDELGAILSGIAFQNITVGQRRISELYAELIRLCPEQEERDRMSEDFCYALTMGLCAEGQQLGFSLEYRKQCFDAGVIEQGKHVGKAR